MKRIALTLLLAGSFAFASAQDLERYEPLMCSGEIPAEFITPSLKKYEQDIEKALLAKEDRKEREDRKRFYLETNFVLDDLLRSGIVLFNDPVSNYLREVTEVLIGDDAELKKNVHIYALRSTAVNAFATDRGNIFVTLGLLAQLENEAQLAFILAHELTHVQEKHAFDLFMEAASLEKQTSRKSILKESTFDQYLVSKNRYSKELEIEADRLGLELFLQTDYSFSGLSTVFDVLKYAYLPFDEVEFSREFLESPLYRFPAELQLESVQAIEDVDENTDDQRSSHPSIGARRTALLARLSAEGTAGRKDFLVSEERFYLLRDAARFELPMLHLLSNELAESVYTTYLLLRKYPDNFYLEKLLCKSLYILAKYNNNLDRAFKSNYREVEGESQQAHFFLNKLSRKESTVLAARYAWLLQQKQPEDAEVEAIVGDLFVELGQHFEGLAGFRSELPPLDTLASEAEPGQADPSSKYDKIRQQKKEAALPGEAEYWRYGFHEFVNDSLFRMGFEEGRKEYLKRKEWDDYMRTRKGRNQWKKYEKKIEKKGLQLGIDRIVIVNPFYLRADSRDRNNVRFIESELGQERFRQLLKEMAASLELDVQMLDVADLRTDQSLEFNEIRLLNDWFDQQVDQDDLSLTPGFNQQKIDEIADKYGTDYFLWPGLLTRQQGKGLILYALLFDVRTGKREAVKFDYLHKREQAYLVRAHVYDALFQIKSKE